MIFQPTKNFKTTAYAVDLGTFKKTKPGLLVLDVARETLSRAPVLNDSVWRLELLIVRRGQRVVRSHLIDGEVVLRLAVAVTLRAVEARDPHPQRNVLLVVPGVELGLPALAAASSRRTGWLAWARRTQGWKAIRPD